MTHLSNRTKEEFDPRPTITTGVHYEIIPSRDFQIYENRANLKRSLLANHFNNNPMIETIRPNHLQIMFDYYDLTSFNSELTIMLRNKNRSISFAISTRSVSQAGVHCYDPVSNSHSITISSTIICNLFNNGETRLRTCGIIVSDRLSALINIFEHEITHLYCSLKDYTRKIDRGDGKMYYGSHGKLFQELVFSYFGHTDFRHSFNCGEALDHLTKEECKIGMTVYFDIEQNEQVYGNIIKINPKKCRIETENNKFYDVPYTLIRKSDKNIIINQKVIPHTISQFSNKKYQVGTAVKFPIKKGYLEGVISKCNPKRARVETDCGSYDVPYEKLF
jgi:hypothetical protein